MDCVVSASAPPLAGSTVATWTFVTLEIACELVNAFAAALFVTTYVKITRLPSLKPLPITSSPKYTSYFPASTSCRK